MTKVIKMMQGKTLYRKRISSNWLDTFSYPYQNRILGQQTYPLESNWIKPFCQQKLTELEGELGNSPIILGDFSAPRSVMD